MPRIPTYTAEGGLRAAPTSPDASALAFNPTAGLGDLAQGIGAVGQLSANFAVKKQLDVAETYSSSALRTFEEESAKFMVEAQKKKSVTIADDYKAFADSKLAEIKKNAPNSYAEKEIEKRGMNMAANLYSSGLRMAADNFIDMTVNELNQSTISMQNTYRTMIGVDPIGASIYLEQAHKDQTESINKRFEGLAPTIASERRAILDNDMAYAAADNDPILARKIVNESKDLNAKTKAQILNHIDNVQESRKNLSTVAIEKAVESQINDALTSLQPLNVQEIEPLLNELSPTKRDTFRFNIATNNEVITNYSQIKGYNSNEQMDHLAGMDVTGNPVKQEAKAKLFELVERSAKQQKEDPVGWLRSNNTEISTAFKYLSSLPDDQQAEQKGWIYKRVMDLQGFAPEGASIEEKKRYLNLPSGLVKVLDKPQATEWAKLINNSTPNTLNATLQQFDDSFGDPAIAAHAYQDLMTLDDGNKVKMGVRVAGSIINPEVRSNFLGAITSAEAIKNLNQKAFNEMVLDLEKHPDYLRFIEANAFDNYQRAPELQEFRESILLYAAAKNGDVKTAIKQVISDNYGFVNQKGLSLAIYRKKQDGSLWTDSELREIENGMSQAFQDFDTSQIIMDATRFPAVSPFAKNGVAKGPEAEAIVKSAVRNAGIFIPEPDGNTMTLYLRPEQENGFPFQVLGKDGKPLKFDIKKFNSKTLYFKNPTSVLEIMVPGSRQQRFD